VYIENTVDIVTRSPAASHGESHG